MSSIFWAFVFLPVPFLLTQLVHRDPDLLLQFSTWRSPLCLHNLGSKEQHNDHHMQAFHKTFTRCGPAAFPRRQSRHVPSNQGDFVP